ncbi:hypothetical protein [Paenibacillus sp. S02]|uniref:hypothetical protein n=1 Tax=Paenibacillus sp. S02 TaxID=2823904 RepID=UPI001C64514F|nr:hypothetical protein [Paenibacillus sp. S02]
MNWGVVFKPKSYISVNRPVITGLTKETDVDVIRITSNKMFAVLKGQHNPNALFDIYLHGKSLFEIADRKGL